jgi:hypothetical protein
MALLLAGLLLMGAAAGSCSSGDPGPDQVSADQGFELREHIATTLPTISPEAAAELDAAIAAAGTSTTTLLGGGDVSSSTSSSRSTTTTSESSSPSSSVPASESSTTTTRHVATADECKLYSQLINFYSAIKPQTDANDPGGTAARVAGPVGQSARGLDQILQVANADVKPAATVIIQWLRDAAAGNPFEADGAEASFGTLQTWYAQNCASK